MKIFTVVGARPQFVKAAVLSRAINQTDGVEEVLVHTGQHYDANMSKVFFDEMDIPSPNHNLQINGGTHGRMTGRMLEGLESLLLEEAPDVVLVYGDTNSTLAGALAAAKLHIPIAHVEAGLRSFNKRMPEEVNRILTDHVSRWLFCPTQVAVENLKSEGFVQGKALDVVNVGDVMNDAIQYYSTKLDSKKSHLPNLPEKYILTTLHRQENVQDIERLTALVKGLNQVHNEIAPVVLPLHPSTAKTLANSGLKLDAHLIEPAGYYDMLRLLKGASLVVTDSGGLQKEAYLFNKFCITMRDQTEWVELIENGVNELVGANTELLVNSVSEKLNFELPFSQGLYGDGHAGEKILSHIMSH